MMYNSRKYSSVEYIIEETLPTISIRNLISVVETLPSITNTVSVDISESVYNEIVSLVDDECGVDQFLQSFFHRLQRRWKKINPSPLFVYIYRL